MPSPCGTVLLVSAEESDAVRLAQIFEGSEWDMQQVRTCRDAARFLGSNAVAAVLSARELPDGCWRDLLCHAPPPIVYSQAADEALWAEVLNLGGADVLATPFAAREVLWAVESAAAESISGRR